MKRLITALAFVVAMSVIAFAQSFPLPSDDDSGSDMDLYPAPPPPIGNFTGNYFNHAPGFQVKTGLTTRCPIR